MLPDLPKLKNDLQECLTRYVSRRAHSLMGVFEDVQKHFIHEGHQMRVHRPDGDQDTTALMRASSEVSIDVHDVPTMTVSDRMLLLNEMAESMAKQMSQNMFATIDETLNKYDQVVDGHGQGFNAEMVFATLEKMSMDFDADGNQKPLSLVVPPEMRDSVKKVLLEIQSDPELHSRHDALIEQKRNEWRDREAARKLVG